MLRAYRYTIVISMLFLSSCVFVDRKKVFEEVINGLVGQVVDDTQLYKPHWINKLETGRIEYGFRHPYGGCSYSIEVDEKTRVILGWRYLSEPQLCWKHVPTA